MRIDIYTILRRTGRRTSGIERGRVHADRGMDQAHLSPQRDVVWRADINRRSGDKRPVLTTK